MAAMRPSISWLRMHYPPGVQGFEIFCRENPELLKLLPTTILFAHKTHSPSLLVLAKPLDMSAAEASRNSFITSDTSTPEMPLPRDDTPVIHRRASSGRHVSIFNFINFNYSHAFCIPCNLCRIVAAALRKLQTPETQIRRASETK